MKNPIIKLTTKICKLGNILFVNFVMQKKIHDEVDIRYVKLYKTKTKVSKFYKNIKGN